jgi:hypothetical protein
MGDFYVVASESLALVVSCGYRPFVTKLLQYTFSHQLPTLLVPSGRLTTS